MCEYKHLYNAPHSETFQMRNVVLELPITNIRREIRLNNKNLRQNVGMSMYACVWLCVLVNCYCFHCVFFSLLYFLSASDLSTSLSLHFMYTLIWYESHYWFLIRTRQVHFDSKFSKTSFFPSLASLSLLTTHLSSGYRMISSVSIVSLS